MHIGIDGNEANIEKKVGSNIYAFNLLQWFNKLDHENKFSIYLKSQPSREFPEENNNWHYKKLSPKILWTRIRLPLELYLSRNKPNVFFTPGHYAPKYCPVPIAISIMDLSFLHYPDMFRLKDLYKLKKWTKDSVLRANHIFTISEFTKKEIINNYKITDDKITVTYPGLTSGFADLKTTSEDIKSIKNKFQIRGKYILYLGTIQPRKNLIRLIKAFNRLNEKDISLVIAGKKGWHYQDIFTQAEKLNNKRVLFIGFVTNKEKIVLLKGAVCFTLVSLYEGFGIPVIEAMAMGTPTVISNNSSLPEIVGKTGILVDPINVDSISWGLTQALQLNKSQRKSLAIKNIEFIKKYNWKKTSEKTLEVLYEIAFQR